MAIRGILRSVKFLACISCICFASSILAAQGSERLARGEIAQRFVANKLVVISPVEYYTAMADIFARSYFIELRNDAQWGPDHPNWDKLFPEFLSALIKVAEPTGQGLDAYLADQLAMNLSVEELSRLEVLFSSIEAQEVNKVMQRIGLNVSSFLIMSNAPTSKLYSKAQKNALKNSLVALQNDEQFMQQIQGKQADNALVELLSSADFKRYQSVIGRAFMDSAGSLGKTPERSARFEKLMVQWRQRVGQGS